MSTAVITQPTYLPWLGYFEILSRADIFVVLDVVQFERRSWQSRNRLRNPNAGPFWLSVPTQHAEQASAIRTIDVSKEHDWAQSHLRSIRVALGSAPYFTEAYGPVENVLSSPPSRLVDLNLTLIKSLCNTIGLQKEFVLASELSPIGTRSALLADICSRIGASRLLSASGSAAYLVDDLDKFTSTGVEVEFQDWTHPVYRQQGKDFISHLSIVDAIANIGAQATRALFSSTMSC